MKNVYKTASKLFVLLKKITVLKNGKIALEMLEFGSRETKTAL